MGISDTTEIQWIALTNNVIISIFFVRKFESFEEDMPQHKSAKKRVRQSEQRRIRNKQKRTRILTAIKKVKDTEDKATATQELQKTISILDRMAVKGIIHQNKAANLKSKLTRHVNALT